MYSEDTLLRLIEGIYDAALAPEHWTQFLEALASVTDGHCVNLIFSETLRPGWNLNPVVRFDPEGIQLYNEHYTALDPWGRIASSKGMFRTGVVGLGKSIVDPRDYARTEFFNEFGKRFGVLGGITAVIRAEPPVAAFLSASERPGGREFGEQEAHLLRRLMPHLQRSLQVHERLRVVSAARNAAEDVIDRLPFGVVFVDASGKTVLVNSAAQQILDARDGLSLRDKTLLASSVAQSAELRALLEGAIAASRGDALRGPGGALALGRPSLKRPLQVLVTPLRTTSSVGLPSRCAYAAVFISDPEQEDMTDDAILQQFFRVTPAEARFARQLLQHQSVEEAADFLGISLNTARTHLKKLFEKTGTRRQAELVRLLGGGVGQLRR